MPADIKNCSFNIRSVFLQNAYTECHSIALYKQETLHRHDMSHLVMTDWNRPST